jgi:ATP-dependent Clp protease, protease subunit
MVKVKIKGVIVSNDSKWIYDWFDMDSTSPKDVSDIIDSLNGEDIELEINSPGGSVIDGSEIYTALKGYSGKITAKIVGLAASSASVIAMAADHIQISPTAQIMIHNVSSRASGDYRDLEHEAEVLKNYNNSIANAYKLKTGLSHDELLDLMNKETWMSAQQAIELKFADEILFDTNNQLIANAGNSMLLPPEVINKIRNFVKNPYNKTDDTKLYQARLNFLKLKGEMIND